MSTTPLFVYGTLLQAGNLFGAYLTRNCKLVAKGKIHGRLYDIGEYPGLVIDLKSDYVYGAIYVIDNVAILKKLDDYEGVGENEEQPDLYLRQLHPIETERGPIAAWVYVYNRPVAGLHLIKGGDYIQYVKKKKSPDS
ncbi:hypothetical protein A0256_16445 [Mucilaginibacter sp. PAMC 26640]|nr:hypothetical protein A0256_16445 [Mucilaginibacter sp. PAMC 26640]